MKPRQRAGLNLCETALELDLPRKTFSFKSLSFRPIHYGPDKYKNHHSLPVFWDRQDLLCTYVGSIPENIRYMYIRVNNNAAYGDADNNSKGKGQKVKEK